MSSPERIPPVFLDKIWGSTRIDPWFTPTDRRIGEVWFSRERDIPLLFKFIFTEQALSVQVHPGDEFARMHENSAGKTEMWHILRADPGGRLALGFREPITPQQMRAASVSGEIEEMLNWFEVKPGETYMVEAGTVHALGAGLALVEIQQFSDVTYRLYDYGRPRPLHLDKAMAVANTGSHQGAQPPETSANGWQIIGESRYFRTEIRSLSGSFDYRTEASGPELMAVLAGHGSFGGEDFRAGEVWMIPAEAEALPIEPNATATILRTFVPRP
ncbi:MAG TPA: class I mannose-6-phosphate isomerase [Bryobacteraceae bacterium]|nr:class I mannose-6-phosphate isomerase [Bryobacteraceae bacterium]